MQKIVARNFFSVKAKNNEENKSNSWLYWKKKKNLYNNSVFLKYGGSDEFIIIWIRIKILKIFV